MSAPICLAKQLASKLRIMTASLRGVDIAIQAQRFKAYRKAGIENASPCQDIAAMECAMAERVVEAFAPLNQIRKQS